MAKELCRLTLRSMNSSAPFPLQKLTTTTKEDDIVPKKKSFLSLSFCLLATASGRREQNNHCVYLSAYVLPAFFLRSVFISEEKKLFDVKILVYRSKEKKKQTNNPRRVDFF